jgi:hypothetical protein
MALSPVKDPANRRGGVWCLDAGGIMPKRVDYVVLLGKTVAMAGELRGAVDGAADRRLPASAGDDPHSIVCHLGDAMARVDAVDAR